MPSREARHSPRSWYPVGPQQELVTRHYLLTEGQRDRAVELGARVITAREADKTERQRAEQPTL
jgi:hypothetical protein